MECVVSVPAKPRWVCERTNYLQELYERAGPPVGKNDGHGVGMRGPRVDEVNTKPVDPCAEMRKRVYARFEATPVILIFDSANTQLIDLLRESAARGCVGTTSAVDGVDDQAWLTGRTVGGSATPEAESARLAAGRGGERSRKHLSCCSTLVSVSESKAARMSGQEPLRPRSAMRSSNSFFRTRARKLQDT